jgi:hypothetical protein
MYLMPPEVISVHATEIELENPIYLDKENF